MGDKLCDGLPLAQEVTKVHYGDSVVVGSHSRDHVEFFGVTHRPICGKNLPPQEGRGRVGLSPSSSPASLIGATGPGDRRVVLDRTAGSLCFGSDCGAAVHPGAQKLLLTPPPLER